MTVAAVVTLAFTLAAWVFIFALPRPGIWVRSWVAASVLVVVSAAALWRAGELGDAVGSTLYYGAGAGAEPTASSVVADVIDVVRTLTTDPNNRVPHLAFQADSLSDLAVLPVGAVETAYYLRIQAKDRPGVLAKVATILSERGINIESILQKEVEEEAGLVPLIIMTHRVREQKMNDAIEALEALDEVASPLMRIRVEQLN